MTSDMTYFVVMITMALAVILTCGAGITWNYFSARRWGESKGEQPSVREHRESSPFADQPAERGKRDQHQLAA
jgi:hypothetical protein